MNSPKENTVERYLVAKVRDLGGRCPKFVSPGYDGVPDRIVLLPGAVMAFVETKRLGRDLDPLQAKFAKDISALGHLCVKIDSREEVDAFLAELARG